MYFFLFANKADDEESSQAEANLLNTFRCHTNILQMHTHMHNSSRSRSALVCVCKWPSANSSQAEGAVTADGRVGEYNHLTAREYTDNNKKVDCRNFPQ